MSGKLLGRVLDSAPSQFLFFKSARTVAPSSAKIGSFSETFLQCFFNEMNRPVIIQQVVVKVIISFFHDLLYYNRPVQKCNLSDPRRALVYGCFLGILFI
jgi:hypothetical protein